MPLFQRCIAVGGFLGFAVGGTVGLIVGLHVYAATAWFAVFELGIPTAVVGVLAGCVAAVIETGSADQARWPPFRLN